jgi:hypothetical protein
MLSIADLLRYRVILNRPALRALKPCRRNAKKR